MINLIILLTLVVGWTIFMLYLQSRHKKRLKQIDREWEERRRRWPNLEAPDGRWLEEGKIEEWRRLGVIRRFIPDRRRRWPNLEEHDGRMLKPTDKLSPKKKMGKHTMR